MTIRAAIAIMDIDRALRDRRLLGGALGDVSSWSVWFAVLRAAFGLKLNPEQQKLFAQVAGNRPPPMRRVRELWAIVGRRGGKSRIAAALAVFFALFVPHKLAAGERGMVLVLAMSKEQAKVVFSYALAFLRQSPALRKEIAETTSSEIRLKNGIVIAIHSTSFRSVRGRTLCACVLDEIAFWRDELSAAPDTEVYSALLPSLLTTGGMMVGISTGYRRAGLLYQKHRDHFGQDSDDTLVVQGSTQSFNGMIDEAALAALRAADPAAAPSEWDGTFRDDIAAFLDDALIDAAVEHGRPLELPPQAGVDYQAFVDAAGGVGVDSYTMGIAHKEAEKLVVDVVRGTTGKFDPAEVTRQYAELVKEYRIGTVVGDYHAAGWVASAWRDHGITYVRSELNKSGIYLETLPSFARGIVRLPDHPKLLRELRLLERHTHRSGKDTISHGKTGSDDFANACCGALRLLAVSAPTLWRREAFLVDGSPTPLPARCDVLFAVLIADERDLGVVYFASSKVGGIPLLILDCEVAPLTTPALIANCVARLVDLAQVCRARFGSYLYTTKFLAAEVERLGYHVAELIDSLVKEGDTLLGLAAAVHLGAHRVSITAQALDKGYPLGFLNTSTAGNQTTDPLRTAALCGVALALDQNRSMRAA
jgi:hypothetical protein